MENIKHWNKKKNIVYAENDIHLQNIRPFTVHSYFVQTNENDNLSGSPKDEVSVVARINNNVNRLWLSRKNGSHRKLKWFTIILFLVMIVFTIALGIIIATKKPKNICLTSSCVATASRSLQYLNNKIDPCVDFYSFACGTFLEEPILPDEIKDRIALLDVSNIVNKQQYEIIKESTTNKLESRVSLIKLLNHCMHVDDKINDEVENVKSILKSLGDWPILMGAKWNESNFDPIKLSLLLNKIGVDYGFFFEFEVRINPIKTHSNVLSFAFQEPLMINPKTYYTIVSIIRLMNNNTQVIEENKKAYEDFFKLILQDPNNSHYLNFITLEKLNSLTGINWVSYVQLLLDNTNVNLDGNEKILFSSNKFVTFLSIFSQTSKRMQANFFFFSIINWMYQYLPNLRYRFQRQMPQISDCVEIVAKSLPLRMNSLYVERFFDTKTKTKVEQMVEEIRSEFLKILQTADWLDNSTKKNAIDKLVAMKTCIGYPEELLQDKVLERYYQSLNVDYNSYLNAILSINAFEKSNHFKGLREPAKNCYWIDNSKDVTMVNAAYHIPGNTIKIPAAFLQDVIFDENRPNYVNYAVAGMVVGHEMTHGFDDKGGEFDKDGNYVNWWSNETTLTFKRKSECIINQYQQYIDPRLNINVNGLLTLGENIADNGGLKQSFLAYNNWVKQNGHEKKLPGLNYTIPQMFWIAFAQFWCSQDSYGAALSRILNDVHAPSRFRVIGTLSNIDDFASDFNCPIGSPMNPKKKCKVW